MRAVLTRLVQALVTLAGAGALVFGMLAVTPGDPARRVLEARGVTEPSPPAIAAVRAELRLDDPLPLRFLRWAADAATGDLGISWSTGQPVAAEFAERLPATLRLTGAALALAVALALVLGAVAAAAPGRWPDVVSRVVALGMLVVPSFVLGVLVLDVLVVGAGLGRVIADGTWATVFLPALTLALASGATWSRVLRTGLLEARSASYLRVSTARGATPWQRLRVHELPNAAAPFLTVVGLGTAALIGGAPIVESVFTWPGVGRYTVEAIDARDMPVVVGFTLVAVVVYVVTSLVVDLVCTLIDPRLRQDVR
ncbi:ABC transporter permease [Pseudonocardia abyssalis]|nr:ABC transporter permease [Pseudonocardia abyssalis]